MCICEGVIVVSVSTSSLFICFGSSLPGAQPQGKDLSSGLTEDALTGSPGGSSTGGQPEQHPLPSVMPRLAHLIFPSLLVSHFLPDLSLKILNVVSSS